MPEQRLGEMLIEAGLVTERQIGDATARHPLLRIGSALVKDGVVALEVVNRTLAQQHGLPALRLSDLEAPDPAARALVPAALARRLCAVGIAVQGSGAQRTLVVAMRDPGDLQAVDELAFAAGVRVDARVAPELLLREALEPGGAAAAPAAPAAPAAEPGLDLAIDPALLPRRGRTATTPRPLHAAGGAAVGAPPAVTGTGADATVLPPLQISTADPFRASPLGGLVGLLLKLALPLAAIVVAVYMYKSCMVSTTRAVGTHHDSRELGLSVEFPDAGWRIAPGMGRKVAARAEYFYRGNAPELPVVGLILVRGAGADAGAGAEALLTEVVSNLQPVGCKSSYARANAIMCVGVGTVGLFGRPMQNAEVEVHGWSMGSDTVLAAMIKPDHTLSETELILGSIAEYTP